MQNKNTFMKKYAFYIALAVCIIAVGAVTVIAALQSPANENTPIEQAQDVNKAEDETLQDAQASASVEPTPSPSASAAKDASSKTKAAVTLKKPLDGEIILAFSGEELIHNKTLDMWMAHNGVDLSAEKNTDVSAALAGEVESVTNDSSMGIVVTLKHSDSKTVYAGLSACDVKEGDKLNAGDKIGTAGTPAFEADSGAHLHFEYIVNGKYVDPEKYFG